MDGHRQHADFEHHLFNQVIVLQQGAGPGIQRIREEEPRHKPCRQKHHIRQLLAARQRHRVLPEDLVKHDPVHDDRHNRRHHRPDGAKKRSGISFAEVILRKTPDQAPAQPQFLRQNQQFIIRAEDQQHARDEQQIAADLLEPHRARVVQRIVVHPDHDPDHARRRQDNPENDRFLSALSVRQLNLVIQP